LMEIKSNIEQEQKYDSRQQSEFKKLLQREKALAGKAPETRENRKVKRICQQEVLRELPPKHFYIPEETNHVRK